MHYFDNSFISITYDKATNALLTFWKISPTSAEFRAGMNKIIDAIRDCKTGKLITDTQQLGAISPEDQAWSNGEWTERALAVGYEKIAIILSSDIFSQISVEDIMNRTGDLSFTYVDSIEAAKKWISQ